MLLLGDCNNHLKEINDNSIDLLLTDPPYFLINDSGKGFMGKDWDSINDTVGLSAICRSKEFASFVLKFFQLMIVEPNTTEGNTVQSIVRTEGEKQNNSLNSTAQPVGNHSRNGREQSKVNFSSVPDYVLTKPDLLDLLSELSLNHTTALENLPENALFVLPYSYLKRRFKNTAAESVLKSPIELQCEDQQIQVSSTDGARINAVIEAMIGSVLDFKSIIETNSVADYAVNTVQPRQYKHIILSNINRLKTIHWVIWLLYVINVTQRRNTIPNSYTINSDLIYQFHKSWATEAYRVLKDGKVAFVMCSPRQDIIYLTIQAFQDSGFKVAYTSIFHSFASGFPKAKNNGDGSYQNFSPKPAVEIILVMSKGRTKTWLDDCRIPYQSEDDKQGAEYGIKQGLHSWNEMKVREGDRKATVLQKSEAFHFEDTTTNEKGRFPANLLVSDDILNDGKITKSTGGVGKGTIGKRVYGDYKGDIISDSSGGYKDEGSYSRYFSLDSWWNKTFPFLIVPKASRQERNKGLDDIPDKFVPVFDETKLVRVNEPDGQEIGNYLKYWRLKQNISVKELAVYFQSRTGGLTGCVWNWEQGVNIPTKEEWIKLKEVLQFDDKYDKQMTEFVEVNKIQNVQDTKFPQVRRAFKHNHHPTVKPLKLMSYLITMGSREGDLVLDPFCGSGTVCIAADQLHRKWIGIEKNPEYAQIIKSRLMVPLSQLKLGLYV